MTGSDIGNEHHLCSHHCLLLWNSCKGMLDKGKTTFLAGLLTDLREICFSAFAPFCVRVSLHVAAD